MGDKITAAGVEVFSAEFFPLLGTSLFIYFIFREPWGAIRDEKWPLSRCAKSLVHNGVVGASSTYNVGEGFSPSM